jgi:putative aldouronate transport system substrate-binding protein
MKKKRRLVSIILALTMILTMAGCGSKSAVESLNEAAPAETTDNSTAAETPAAAEETTEAAALDTSERVDLVFYVMGDAPVDEIAVEDALNEILLEKVNATIDFQFSTWTDFQQKYSLELTAGQADLIYVANWLNYGQLATSGAFEELDDLLNTVAPALKDTVGESNLNMCRVGGKVYAVPCSWAEYTCNGVKYREDLREKYDLPVPDSLENFEAYMLGIKENEPGQGLLTVTTEESQGLLTAFDAAWILNLKYPWVNANGLPYGLASNYDTPSDVYDYWYSDDFTDDMKLMKKWADLGFWSKSALSDTNDSEAYKSGLCVAEIAGQNPNKQIAAIKEFEKEQPDWKSEYIAYGEVTNTIYPGHATQNGTAIVRGSKNPERALKVLELLMTDESINRLVQCGIEGTNYELDADGIYHNLSTSIPEAFPYEGFNTWSLRNGDYKLPQETDVILNQMFDKYEELGSKTKFPNVNIYNGFNENYDAYQAERTAVSNVMKQYLAPLQAGLVDDVDAAVEEFRQKMTDAGIEVCRDGFKEQWEAYCNEYGYK